MTSGASGRPAADAGAVRESPATRSWCPIRAIPATATWCAPSRVAPARSSSRPRPISSRPGAGARGLGPRTRGLLLGSPSNPTGTAVAKSGIAKKIARFVAERGGVLIVDEIYQGAGVWRRAAVTALGLPGEVAIVNSFSKYFCMTGWRLGWVVLPEVADARVRKARAAPVHLRALVAQHRAIACFPPASLENPRTAPRRIPAPAQFPDAGSGARKA